MEKRKIKSIQIHKSFLIPESAEEFRETEEFIEQITHYNKNGDIIETAKFVEDHELEIKIIRVYDETNFLAEETHYHEDETEFTEKYIFKKNGSGKLNSFEKHYQDGSIEITNFEYNEAGNLIKKIQFDEDGNTEKTNEYIFDSSNQLIESKEMDESGSIHENILLKYDSKNRLIEAEELDIASQTGIITLNSYNEKDEISESIIRDAKGKLLRKITNMYDESGNIIKRNLENYNEYHRIDITNYSYDHESRIVSEEVLGPFEEIRQKTNYEYNADGNLEITYHYETENTQNPGSHYYKTRMQYEFYE